MSRALLTVVVTEEAEGHALRFTRVVRAGALGHGLMATRSVRITIQRYREGDIRIGASDFLMLRDALADLAHGWGEPVPETSGRPVRAARGR